MIVALLPEAEVLKLIIQGGATGVAAGLILLLAMVLTRYFRHDEKQDEREATERAAWMTMLDKVLNTALDNQQGKFSELATMYKEEQADMTEKFTAALNDMVEAMRKNQETAQEQLVEQMIQHMADVTARPDNQFELLDANIKEVPTEVKRVLAEDLAAQTTAIQAAIDADNEGHQEIIREAVNGALKPLLAQIEEKLDQLPGQAISRRVIREEIDGLQRQMIDQIAGQLAPLLEKLTEIVNVLDKLQPCKNNQEHGETSSDSIPKEKKDVGITA